MADERAQIAHLLRRTGFGPHPGQVEALVPGGVDGAIEAVLAAPALSPEPPALGTDDDYSSLVNWWLDTMADPAAGLHEKMVWFWHGHLTSSLDKTSPALMWRQHQLLRTHALGNFRQLLQEITVDAAMLEWLDGAWSRAEAPNENYARELMELFALGHGAGYTEADVRAGAKALAGYWIDSEDRYSVRQDPEASLQGSVEFLGRTVSNAAEVVDAVCDHPACAPHIVGRLHTYLYGTAPDDGLRAELAQLFVDSGMEIAPVVEALVRHPSFMTTRGARPRFPLEWYVAASSVLGVRNPDPWLLHQMGQVPFQPPNVAGWPLGRRWLSAGATYVRAHLAWDYAWDTEVVDSDDPVSAVLERAGLFDVSEATRSAMDMAAVSVEGRRERATVLHALAVVSPEFVLA